MSRKAKPKKPLMTPEERMQRCTEAGRGYWTKERKEKQREYMKSLYAVSSTPKQTTSVEETEPEKMPSEIELLLQNRQAVDFAKMYLDHPELDPSDLSENAKKLYDYWKP